MKRNKKNIKTLIIKDGSKYIGEIKNGKLTGKGTFTLHDKTKYLGKFRYGKVVKFLIIKKN